MFGPNSLSSASSLVTSAHHHQTASNNGQSTTSVDNNSSSNHRVQSSGSRQQMTGSPYLSGYSGYNSVGQHSSTPSGYPSHHHQDPYGMYPMDPAMAWHAAYTAGHLYRGYEAASLVAADPGSVWPPPPPSHHQMASGSGSSGFSNMQGNPSDSSCNNLSVPSNSSSTIAGNELCPTSMGDSSNITHNLGGECRGGSDSVSPPPSDYKPSILYGSSGISNAGQTQKKHGNSKAAVSEDHTETDRMGNSTTSSLSRANHGSGGTALHPSPDSGVAISDNVSSSGSPNHPVGLIPVGVSINGQSAIAALGTSNSGSLGVSGDLILGQQSSGSKSSQHNNDGDFAGLTTSRPQPVRSPYEWMKRPSFQTRPSGKEGRTRTKDKYRVVYSDHQRLELEKEFHYSRYITIRRKSELAQGLSLTERQVKIWFQNRRAKERKHMKKRDELMQKEKLDVAATFHAGQLAAASAHASAANMHAASQMAAAFNAGMPPMHLTHPGVMSAAAAASSAAALSHL